MKNSVFLILSAFCVIGAIIHIGGFFGFVEGNSMPHLFFVFLNIWGIYLMQKRPPFLFYLFPILFIQQYYSHGTHFYKCYMEKGEIRLLDMAVFFVMPIAYYFIWVDLKNRKVL
jgi:hypothetical protein